MSGNFNILECKSCTENNRCEQCKKLIEGLIEKFPSVYQFCNGNLNKFVLLLRKGSYPYEDINSWEKFDETPLPDKKAFYSNLNLEDISNGDYAHAQKVWDVFKIKTLAEYHDLYVQSDTLLPEDVFEDFRNMCLKICGLDPVCFVSASGLAWQACLKKTEVKLELITDYDMLLMIEKGIRGGICQAVHRYAKANNKYMIDYDKSIESSYIEYLDANNLYGWAMSQKLLVKGFKCVNNRKLSGFKDFIKKYDEDSSTGYFLEVDIDYPKESFNFHKDLPFLPKRKKVEKVDKLICSIEDKEKYVIYIRALKQALNHGLKLKKVRTIVQFKQKAWLKPNIDMNTELRKKAQNEFEKKFFKLMNNSVFGKTVENARNHRDIKLIITDKRRKRLVSEPTYHSHKRFSDHLMEIEMKKTRVKMIKPLYLGMSILHISKTIMYGF